MANSVPCSHALVSGPKSKRPASEGGLYLGQPVIMCSAVCSGSPHSHAALSDRPHFFSDDLKQPTPQGMVRLEPAWWSWCYSGFVQDVPVILLGFSCQGEGSCIPSETGWGDSSKDWQVGCRSGFQTTNYYPESTVDGSFYLVHMWTSAPGRGTVFGYG
ncbi:hypothetical protein AOLI_G00321710 [Acnodon oligacanthus]